VTTEDASANDNGNGHADCLICGYQNPWSLGIRFDPGDGDTVRGHFRGNPRLQGYQGLLHGGVLAALLDSAMTHCLFRHGVQGVTGDLHVRFVRPVSYDAALDVRAHILAATPPLYRLRAELLEGQQVMAWGEATFIERGRIKLPAESHA
jgi:uncharacterized protein (TIGR00369 family)